MADLQTTEPLKWTNTPAIHAATPDEFLPPLGQWTIIGGLVLLGGFVVAVGLAAMLPYRVVVKAPAVVRPLGELRLVEAATDGTIKAIKVKPNQVVRQGEVLATIEDATLQTQKQQHLAAIQSTEQQLRQINAQITALDQQIAAENSQQQRAIASAQADLQLSQRTYKNSVTSTQSDLQEAQAALKLAQDELTRYENLANTGAVSTLQIQEKTAALEIAKARLAKVQAALDPSQAEVARARERVAQEQFRGDATIARLQQDREERLRQYQEMTNQLAKERRELEQLEQVLAKTAIRAPIAGTILNLTLRNTDQVVRLGDEIAQIAPATEGMSLKALVASQDINKVKVGQSVQVRISACPYPDFGTLPGTVATIAPDAVTIPEESDQRTRSTTPTHSPSTYAVTISPTRLSLSDGQRDCTIQPGLEGQADIIAQQESVLQFVLRKARLWMH